MKKLNIIIGNKYKGAAGTYIGRGSPLGNPFPIDETRGNTRNKVIEQYEVWLRDQIKSGINKPLLNQLNSIANEAIHTGSCTIVRFCAPKRCHGEVIRKVIEEAYNAQLKGPM